MEETIYSGGGEVGEPPQLRRGESLPPLLSHVLPDSITSKVEESNNKSKITQICFGEEIEDVLRPGRVEFPQRTGREDNQHIGSHDDPCEDPSSDRADGVL